MSQLPSNFIETIVSKDIEDKTTGGRIHTRFPPEPNGYLHIGHALSITLNYGIAQKYGGLFNVRFDDTNPTKEEEEFVQSILLDVAWLGAKWDDRLFFASDYFHHFYRFAVQLIEKDLAYVCDLSQEEMREYRGTLTEPGKDSPYRTRTKDENLDLFRRMKEGEFPTGARTLRAKIDMAAPNLNMRDPVMYRILHAEHHRTGDEWCIYPMYDYAHPLSDALENITHSICTLEYADHRPLYDWFLDKVDLGSVPNIVGRPKQIEFARLNMTHTVMSKRRLRRLVEEGFVDGWDDPRMPTIAGLRRRGYTPSAIRAFSQGVGVSRSNSVENIAFLEHCARDILNKEAMRVMAVLNPVKVVLINYPEDRTEWLQIENNPEDPLAGTRSVPFSKEIFIEKEDFMENPPKKFFRLSPGQEVRLKSAYIIKCEEVIKDESGEIREIHCTYDPDSRSGSPGGKRRVKATLHWVCAKDAFRATVRLYDTLFTQERPEDDSFTECLNPDSLVVLRDCMLESGLQDANPKIRYQFLRQGYFALDSVDYAKGELIFNRIVTLRDTWARLQKT